MLRLVESGVIMMLKVMVMTTIHTPMGKGHSPSLLMNIAPSMYRMLPSSLVKLKLQSPVFGKLICPVNCSTVKVSTTVTT